MTTAVLYAQRMITNRTFQLAAVAIVITQAVTTASARTASASPADVKKPMDIMILGDSQLSFGSGNAFQSFFSSLGQRCKGTGLPDEVLTKISNLRVGILGVRATGLHTWLSRTRKGKRMICVPDPAGLVNASVYGALRYGRSKWVQVGRSRNHRFCKPGRSGFEAIFAEKRYRPRLVIMNYLGLSAWRWTKRSRVETDFKELDRQLPRDTSCVVFTSAPTYTAKINRPRLKAQGNLKEVLGRSGSRCTFVPGLTPKTVKALQGNARLFYRRSNGTVKDPFHPNPAGAQRYLSLRRPAICRAVADALMDTDLTPAALQPGASTPTKTAPPILEPELGLEAGENAEAPTPGKLEPEDASPDATKPSAETAKPDAINSDDAAEKSQKKQPKLKPSLAADETDPSRTGEDRRQVTPAETSGRRTVATVQRDWRQQFIGRDPE